MLAKVNFFGESIELPVKHTYSTMEDLQQARQSLKRWSDEWREKKSGEMEIFNGKREVNVNEGETATSISQSRVSANKAEKGKQLAQDAQKQLGGLKQGLKRTEGGPHVHWGENEEPQSPNINRLHMQESDARQDIKFIDDALAGDGGVDGMPMVSSLAELSKSKSRMVREDDLLAEELEEEKELEEQANNIKQHFIDIKSGQQYDPDKRFGVIEDGTQLVYDNITTSYDLNLPPDYYLKYVQDNMPARDEKNSKPWFIRPHHIESLTNHFNSLKDDVLNTRYFSNYNRDKEVELTNNEKAIDYIENHLEQLRMKQNAMTLAKTGGQKDFEQLIEEMQKKTSVEAYKGFQAFIKDKNPRPSPKILCIEAYESILTD